jgi:hypothetical protein
MTEKATQFGVYEDLRLLADALDDVLTAYRAGATGDACWRDLRVRLRDVLAEIASLQTVRGIQLASSVGHGGATDGLRELVSALDKDQVTMGHLQTLEGIAQQLERKRSETFARLRGALR